MFLELARALSFFLSLLSLYPVLVSAFFVPGTAWQERLLNSLLHIAFAACICLASGILFIWPTRAQPHPADSVFSTLPVRVFLLAMAGMTLLFLTSWYLDVNFMPQMRHNCCGGR